jgi:tol-pal system protein YbgF
MNGICHVKLATPARASNSPRSFFQKRGGSFFGAWILILWGGLFFVACGGGRNKTVSTTSPEDEIDIDKLLSTTEQEQRQAAEDDEVLRLLGITPESRPGGTATETAQTTPEPQPVPSDLQKELEQKQQALNEKNREVANLRSTLAEKETLIQELQQQLDKSRSRPQNNSARGSDNYVQRYAQARDLYEQRRYSDAVVAFQNLLAEDDKSSYADNCQYWIGESYYGLGKFAQAIAEFEKVFVFPRSNKNDAAHLKIGLCYLRLGDRQQARSQFEQLIASYPSSPYVQYARRYLGRL